MHGEESLTHRRITESLSRAVAKIDFSPPVACVYNPLEYALAPHLLYWDKFGGGKKEAVFLGMNPGPWGMAQSGVPFGEITAVRDWMGILAPVGKPSCEHPKRRVEGFSCKRSEVSGKRLWGWAAERFGEAGSFFGRFFVLNYCPLMFMEESARNRTPDKLRPAEKEALFSPCDEALRRYVELLGAGTVIGIGGFARERARSALAGSGVRIEGITHPSPANPAANRGWAKLADAELSAIGIKV